MTTRAQRIAIRQDEIRLHEERIAELERQILELERQILELTPDADDEAATLLALHQRVPGTNTGHGHVWARPDGAKARCGGPAICSQCAADQAALLARQSGFPDHIDRNGRGVYIGLTRGHSEPMPVYQLAPARDGCAALVGADRHQADDFDHAAGQLAGWFVPGGDSDPLGR